MAFCHAAADAGAAARQLRRGHRLPALADGRVTGIRARDLEGGGELEVRARMVVIATGPGVRPVAGASAGIEPAARARCCWG